MTTEPGGTGASWTLSEIVVLPVRACASAIWMGRVFKPVDVAAGTVALKEKVLSPGVMSPFVPSSKKVWVADPPIKERSPVTVSPVLVGFAPGVTATVKRVEWPACTGLGLAEPVPDGEVGTRTVSEMGAALLRACASLTVVFRVFAPPVVPPATVAEKEKTLSA